VVPQARADAGDGDAVHRLTELLAQQGRADELTHIGQR
jgi:hypothetical protein